MRYPFGTVLVDRQHSELTIMVVGGSWDKGTPPIVGMTLGCRAQGWERGDVGRYIDDGWRIRGSILDRKTSEWTDE